MRDTIRSMFLLLNAGGGRQAACANVLFSPDLNEFLPSDFGRATAILERSKAQLGSLIEEAQEQYRAFCLGATSG
jgi:hypothetical protein